MFDSDTKFPIGGFLSGIRNFRRKKLYDKLSRSLFQDSFNDISWQDFEFLVGEYFRRWQFSVEETGSGINGGVDLIARKDREEYLVRCKHKKAGKVGVKVAQDLLGATAGSEANGGILVVSSEFTKDAVAFAKANNIALLGGRELHRNMKSQLIFENRPDRRKERALKRVKWLLATLLAAAICFSTLNPGKIGKKEFLPDDQEHWDKKNDQISGPVKQGESKDFKFTDAQVQRAMDEVLSKKKRRQSEPSTTDSE